MPTISQFKVVASLPATLAPDAVYYVRVGTGFDIYVTNSSGTVVAYPTNQAVALADLWSIPPIGTLVALWDHLAGVTPPPTNQSYRWVRLTASDSYNSGVLSGESVSGSAPLVQATAVISDASSPLNGQTVRLINTERRVLRAGSSGTVEADAFQGHIHQGGNQRWTGSQAASGAAANGVSTDGTGQPQSDGTNGSPRTANETRMKNVGATYYLRIR